MKRVLPAWVGAYLRAWWLPVTSSTLILGLIVCLPTFGPSGLLRAPLSLLFDASLLGVLVVAIHRLVKRRWLQAGLQFALLTGLSLAVIFASWLGPSRDGFADHLVIPAGLAVTEPLERREGDSRENADAFQAALIAAMAGPGTADPSINAELPSLATLQRRHPDILRRYLATSIAWRVFREDGEVFATRRWVVQGGWSYDLHGYYSSSDLDRWSQVGTPRFQTRLTLGFSGRAWGDRGPTFLIRRPTILTSGRPLSVPVEKPFDEFESSCVLPVEGIAVEVFEQSAARERRLTKAALRFLENELRPLASDPTWETIQKIVPAGSAVRGEPSLMLRKSFQPGIYEPEIRGNPGEPGRIYLKAFEVTRGTPLSVRDLEEYSNEYVGWSDDPHQQFFSNTIVTIDEGDWGQPYAARFEVWFVPNSGQPERELMEKVFRIEGWQR